MVSGEGVYCCLITKLEKGQERSGQRLQNTERVSGCESREAVNEGEEVTKSGNYPRKLFP